MPIVQWTTLAGVFGFMLLLAFLATLNDRLENLNTVAMVIGLGIIVALLNKGSKL